MDSFVSRNLYIVAIVGSVLFLFGHTIVIWGRQIASYVGRVRSRADGSATPAPEGTDEYARGYRAGLEAANQAYAKTPKA